MKLAFGSLVGLCLCMPFQARQGGAQDQPDDLCWAPGLGRVEIFRIGGRNLRLEIEGPAGATRRELELATLPADRQVIQARVAAFMESGLVLALVVEEGDRRSYRFALTRELAPDRPTEEVQSAPSAELTTWWLSEPIFSDAGAPYRIVDLHNPGGDSLEITFRRGSIPLGRMQESSLDELVFVDSCPGPEAAVLQPGRSNLLRLTSTGR